MGLFSGLFKKEEKKVVPQQTVTVEEKNVKRHRITGTDHYMENIMKFAVENPVYKMTKSQLIKSGNVEKNIFQYKFDFSKVELIPEPENEFDHNAIMVLIDGEKVGYIKKGSCKQILNQINDDRIESISGKIYGGASKTVECISDDDPMYELEKDKTPIKVDVFVTLK